MGHRMFKSSLAAALLQIFVTTVAGADSLPDFYQGRTITLYIGAEPGAEYDLYARALGRHMARHIAGGPAILPTNMPGAGGMILGNYLAKLAPRDGTSIGVVGSLLLFEPLFRGRQSMAQFQGPDMTMIGNGAEAHWAFLIRHSAGITSIDDLRREDLIVGTTSQASDGYILTHAIKQILGLDHLKLVVGYRGIRDVAGALERGEISGCVMDMEDIMALYPQWLTKGAVDVIAQFSRRKRAKAPIDAPLVTDLVTGDSDKSALDAIVASTMLARPLIGPPEIPSARAKALRDAFLLTFNDPDFLAEMSRIQIAPDPTSGDRMQDVVKNAYALPPSILARIRAVLAE
jgi:tripartite-type tricarboxylate transporter receptor subunit TctC